MDEEVRHHLTKEEQRALILKGESVLHPSRPGQVMTNLDALPSTAEIERSPIRLAQEKQKLQRLITQAQQEQGLIDQQMLKQMGRGSAGRVEARHDPAPLGVSVLRPVSPAENNDVLTGDEDVFEEVEKENQRLREEAQAAEEQALQDAQAQDREQARLSAAARRKAKRDADKAAKAASGELTPEQLAGMDDEEDDEEEETEQE